MVCKYNHKFTAIARVSSPVLDVASVSASSDGPNTPFSLLLAAALLAGRLLLAGALASGRAFAAGAAFRRIALAICVPQ